MNKVKGFTLIEILIALLIFAILTTITASSLYYIFNISSRVNEQAKRLNSIQLALSLIQKDCLQALGRAVRGNDMHLFPAFIGRQNYLELTRDGILNPNNREKHSSLKRIALVCTDEHQLVRRTWGSLDVIDREVYEDKMLLDNLNSCHFNFINQNLQKLALWRPQVFVQNKKKEILPKAIELNLILGDWGEMNLVFVVGGATDAPS